MPLTFGRTVAVLFLGAALWAQEAPAPQAPPQQPAPTPGPPGQGTPTPGQPGGRQPFPQDPRAPQPGREPGERTPFPDQQQRAIFLSGKVVLDDGTPPPDPVVIERVCNGVARPEAYTDSKGRFSFQLGQNMGVFADASVSSAAENFPGGGGGGMGSRSGGFGGTGRGISERDLMGCELRAVLPGFRSEVVNLSGRRAFDNPDVGTIIMRRLGNVEGTTISATSLQAPKDARKAYEKGREAFRKKKLENAEKELTKAVELYPKYAVAWFELGMLREQQNNAAEARKCYEQALAADAKYVNPYVQMAQMWAKEAKWQEVADTTDRITKLNPFDFPRAYFLNAVANYNLQRTDAAEKAAREAQKLDERHQVPQIEHLLGAILAQKRDYSGAAQALRNYLKFAPNASNAEQVRGQLSELERLAGSGAPQPQP